MHHRHGGGRRSGHGGNRDRYRWERGRAAENDRTSEPGRRCGNRRSSRCWPPDLRREWGRSRRVDRLWASGSIHTVYPCELDLWSTTAHDACRRRIARTCHHPSSSVVTASSPIWLNTRPVAPVRIEPVGPSAAGSFRCTRASILMDLFAGIHQPQGDRRTGAVVPDPFIQRSLNANNFSTVTIKISWKSALE